MEHLVFLTTVLLHCILYLNAVHYKFSLCVSVENASELTFYLGLAIVITVTWTYFSLSTVRF